jgi:DNA polymerase-4
VAREIYATAIALYSGSGLDSRARLRLVGVRAAGLRPAAAAARQLAFDDRPTGWREAEQAVDKIARRFGSDAVRPAALVPADRDGRADRGSGRESGPGPGPGSGRTSDPGRPAPSKGHAETRILGNEPGM